MPARRSELEADLGLDTPDIFHCPVLYDVIVVLDDVQPHVPANITQRIAPLATERRANGRLDDAHEELVAPGERVVGKRVRQVVLPLCV